MKLTTTLILALGYFTFPAMAQKGFTSKAEAKNVMKGDKKDGKWVEYYDNYGKSTTDTAAPYYKLSIYKAGMLNGLCNYYMKKGTMLKSSIPYAKGKMNGTAKYFFDDGKLQGETMYKDDNMNGLQKSYYESGKERNETTWVNGKAGASKSFDENGNPTK